MEKYQIVTIILIAIAMGVQGVAIASRVLLKNTSNDYTRVLGVSNSFEVISGYYYSGIVLSSFSLIFMVFLIIGKIVDKFGLRFDIIMFQLVTMLQLALGTLLVIELRNTNKPFNDAMTSKSQQESLGFTSTPQYQTLSNDFDI